MDVGLATSRLFVKGLVVPDPEPVGAEEQPGRFTDPLAEGEGTNPGVVLPKVRALEKGLFVERLVLEVTGVPSVSLCHSRVDSRSESLEFVGAQKIVDHDEAVAFEGADLLRCHHGHEPKLVIGIAVLDVGRYGSCSQGWSRSVLGSDGRPRTLSAVMLRMISTEPASIPFAVDLRNA